MPCWAPGAPPSRRWDSCRTEFWACSCESLCLEVRASTVSESPGASSFAKPSAGQLSTNRGPAAQGRAEPGGPPTLGRKPSRRLTYYRYTLSSLVLTQVGFSSRSSPQHRRTETDCSILRGLLRALYWYEELYTLVLYLNMIRVGALSTAELLLQS